MNAAIEHFLDEVRGDPRSSPEMVDIIEDILTRRYLAGDDMRTNRLRHVGCVAAPGLGASRLGDRSSEFQIHALGFRLRNVTACPRR